MIDLSLKILKLLDKKDIKKLSFLVALMCIVGVFEVAGIVSIMPLLVLISSPELVETNKILNFLYVFTNQSSVNSFLISLAVVSLIFIISYNGMSAFCSWRLIKFSQKQWQKFSEKLLMQYLEQKYEFFLNKNSADLVLNVIGEVGRMTNGVFLPLLNMVAKVVVLCFILITVIIINPIIAFSVGFFMAAIYGAIFYLLKNKISSMSNSASMARTKANRVINEGLHGIKDIKLLGKERVVMGQYSVPTQKAAQYEAYHQFFNLIPKFVVETVSFSLLMGVAIFFIANQKTDEVVPLLGLYAFAGYRIMPALAQIFNSTNSIRYNGACVDALLRDYAETEILHSTSKDNQAKISFNDEIVIENLSYVYPFSSVPVFENISLIIKSNTTTGIIGKSGSGKTTLVDVIMGLLEKSGGKVMVDGHELSIPDMRAWRANIGYVPQHIYLTDDTLAKNIAFGVPENEIDKSSLERATKTAKIYEFIKELPDGFSTLAGERGVRLSGGQKQRIGIARALYYNPKVLVMDEATSSLDNETEQAVMDAINELSGKKTIIIIAHRMSTVDKCDIVYKVHKGHLVPHVLASSDSSISYE